MKPSGEPAENSRAEKGIGLFGGTFNPVHSGHILAAQTAMARLAMTTVLFIPAALPPHKSPEHVVAAADRLEMLRLAVSGVPGLAVSEVELTRTGGSSYTIDTVRHFLADASPDTRYYLMVGLDAFLEIHTWKSYQTLLQLIPIVVLARPDFQPKRQNDTQNILQHYLQSKISASYDFSIENKRFECANRPPLYLLSGGLKALSATFVRERIRSNADIGPLVPARVAEYIKRKGLYR
ncbi:MAG: nicotinate-nucleotide adenylyltransferase [Desulfobacterales bacterium]|jgi:nicotinate-nucleotide adenylyltransferase|nr:nicotinate-nucleotide adenylyltransferase [Desulfobacterales bacterium]